MQNEEVYELKLSNKIWNLNEVPREDWGFVRYRVYGKYRKCDICGQRMNRVHFLTHDAVGEIQVGKTCAAKLLKTYNPEEVEREYDQKLRDLTESITDPEDKFDFIPRETSKYGNWYKMFGSYMFKIQKNDAEYGGGFKISLTRRTNYETVEGAVEAMEMLIHLICKNQNEEIQSEETK